MRDTVFCLVESSDTEAIRASIHDMVKRVQAYVPGYRLKQTFQFEPVSASAAQPASIPPKSASSSRLKVPVTIFPPCRQPGHHDIGGARTAERLASQMTMEQVA